MYLGNIVYIFLFYCLLLLSFLFNRIKNFFTLYLACSSVIVVSVFLGFRSLDSGKDTHGYVKYFTDGFKNFNFEFGFYYFSNFLSYFLDAAGYLYVIAVLSIIFIALAAFSFKIKNISLVVLIYSGLLPGLDMLTNTIRNGLALNISALIIILSLHINKFKILTLLPAMIHNSTVLTALISALPVKYKLHRVNVFLFSLSSLLFLAFSFINIDIYSFSAKYNTGSDLLSKLVRYIILDKDLLDKSVEIYFKAISLTLALPYVYCVIVSRNFRYDEFIHRLMFVAMLLVLFYAAFSLAEFSYRFMYLSYPLLVITSVYCYEKYFKSTLSHIVFYSFTLFLTLITFTTSTFGSYKLLYLL